VGLIHIPHQENEDGTHPMDIETISRDHGVIHQYMEERERIQKELNVRDGETNSAVQSGFGNVAAIDQSESFVVEYKDDVIVGGDEVNGTEKDQGRHERKRVKFSRMHESPRRKQHEEQAVMDEYAKESRKIQDELRAMGSDTNRATKAGFANVAAIDDTGSFVVEYKDDDAIVGGDEPNDDDKRDHAPIHKRAQGQHTSTSQETTPKDDKSASSAPDEEHGGTSKPGDDKKTGRHSIKAIEFHLGPRKKVGEGYVKERGVSTKLTTVGNCGTPYSHAHPSCRSQRCPYSNRAKF